MEIGDLSDCNYCWHAGGGRAGEGVQVEGRGGSGAQPRWGPGGGSPLLSGNELKMFHEQILS